MKYNSSEYVLKLHKKLITAIGGSSELRDIELLKSSIENSKATFNGEDLYPTLEDKCANICYSMINNHSFVERNKRIGIYVMLILLEYNGIKLRFTQNELINLGLGIGKGDFKQEYIVLWVKNHYTK
ncbi:type II toxin-antitoxin system death-on-curing family toxin [Clostridium pasteurianum]|uniref:Death-on-curing family protein n=1 Tax=Clostridium pasteurianum BC1 TaxID=86416 RepID=R4K693_CLOPA|nr:type II toxin-antitoxin system death-on-curing family toxin [Clostridium pasteurianum]AGK98058.1 death-on-curing family protein [Clostridium pasteurianum BC1]